jgi:drug/metabolite transporter (DMT)-like permease
MFAILLAILAALSWGFSAVFVRSGLRHVQTALGTLISLTAGLVFTAILVLIFQRDDALNASREAILLFGLIGILNFPIGRFFNYMSMSRLGVGRSTPILASAPLFAVVIAVVFTDEDLTLATAAGTALIIGGVYVTLSGSRA